MTKILFDFISRLPSARSSGHLVIWSSIFLAACGFTPMYGERQQAALMQGVRIDAPNDLTGQKFRHELEDKLNPTGVPANPAYMLKVTLQSASSGIGVARDGTISRYNILLGSNYQLIRLTDNKLMQADEIQHVASFNNQPNQYFSTYISQKDSVDRAIDELAELYRQRIGLLLLKVPSP